MPAPLSPDLRIRLVNWYSAGKGTLREAAELFGVGEATAQRWVIRFQRSGDVEPLPMGGSRRQRRLAETDHDAIHRMVSEDPSLTVLELCERLAENGGPSVSRTTMTRARAARSDAKKNAPRFETVETPRVVSLRSAFVLAARALYPVTGDVGRRQIAG